MRDTTSENRVKKIYEIVRDYFFSLPIPNTNSRNEEPDDVKIKRAFSKNGITLSDRAIIELNTKTKRWKVKDIHSEWRVISSKYEKNSSTFHVFFVGDKPVDIKIIGITAGNLLQAYREETGMSRNVYYQDIKKVCVTEYKSLSPEKQNQIETENWIDYEPGKGDEKHYYISPNFTRGSGESESPESTSESNEVGEENTLVELPKHGVLKNEATVDVDGENEEKRKWEKELQRIREKELFLAKLEDEIKEERAQRKKEKEDIKKLLGDWLDRLPLVYNSSTRYLYIKETYIHDNFVPSNRLSSSQDDVTGQEFDFLLYEDAYISYFGQTLNFEEDWPYKKYASAYLPEITKLFEDMKKGAQENFRKKMNFSIEECIRNRKEEYREVYTERHKGGCTDSGVICQVEMLQEMIKKVQREKYY